MRRWMTLAVMLVCSAIYLAVFTVRYALGGHWLEFTLFASLVLVFLALGLAARKMKL